MKDRNSSKHEACADSHVTIRDNILRVTEAVED
ncbi:hypothetical protein PC110_g21774 [Phytophthora cactorum]|uniref:Uncharacterized protein n=1 Tax=Phytophthora cactorum TaxID=29920 RepID=A0A329RD27_9STRA|nr:hypothetical protein PC113_g22299 [Phytophthora cactorum]KAG2875651.1 hypothetical protein PC114_g24599 [Phytophthora cactorum]KAG2886079.1 hypothetical protein PC117_g25434 [Phytophthora cactorum]KAG2964383.1 hypothetical protein PC119_g25265 [Phytophthora cactorum]RAW21786.1 hypothetical protein PC110_g21774 [Phytophthora cactorum]